MSQSKSNRSLQHKHWTTTVGDLRGTKDQASLKTVQETINFTYANPSKSMTIVPGVQICGKDKTESGGCFRRGSRMTITDYQKISGTQNFRT
jgi:hypothetical protein